jgi:SAM-dependent methyltransferase
MNSEDWIGGTWVSDWYQKLKEENFRLIDNFLSKPPLKILDIGCGLAWESRMFNKKYGSQLWLIDGDVEDNDKKLPGAGEGAYHQTADEFLYYYSLERIDAELKNLGTKNYSLIDCKNINLENDLTFDLITSWVSCGFHYPATTYKDLIEKHSTPDTKLIMDIRKGKHQIIDGDQGIEIINIINERQKYVTAEVKFIKN